MVWRAGSSKTVPTVPAKPRSDQCKQTSVEAVNDLWAICLTTLCLGFPICKAEKTEMATSPFMPALQLHVRANWVIFRKPADYFLNQLLLKFN